MMLKVLQLLLSWILMRDVQLKSLMLSISNSSNRGLRVVMVPLCLVVYGLDAAL